MITKRELNHITTGLRATSPKVIDYTPETAREMVAAAKQWRKDVDSIASMLELAHQRSGAKRVMFNKEEFLKACGVEK